MIVLDYTLSPAQDEEDDGIDLREADEMTLRYHCFAGDIIFKVDDADFSTHWGWVTVLDFAAALRFVAGALESEPEEMLDFTESEASIRFSRDGENVAIQASYVDASAAVPYGQLALEADLFLARVIDDLTRAHPELSENEFITALSGAADQG